jgi:hypothetical protein
VIYDGFESDFGKAESWSTLSVSQVCQYYRDGITTVAQLQISPKPSAKSRKS